MGGEAQAFAVLCDAAAWSASAFALPAEARAVPSPRDGEPDEPTAVRALVAPGPRVDRVLVALAAGVLPAVVHVTLRRKVRFGTIALQQHVVTVGQSQTRGAAGGLAAQPLSTTFLMGSGPRTSAIPAWAATTMVGRVGVAITAGPSAAASGQRRARFKPVSIG